jgi:protein-disulfide isomerase
MDTIETNISRWVESRLASLNTSRAWKPDAPRALGRLKARKVRRIRMVWGTAMAAAAGFVCLMLLMAQPACASPYCIGFLKTAAAPIQPPAVAPMVEPPMAVAPAKPVLIAADVPPKAAKRDTAAATLLAPSTFKQAGSATAPLVCEIYADYQCPSCAVLYRDIVPRLMTDYVQPGKMKLIHRDYPLPQHAYARIAARYANAAGALGYYDTVVGQLFRTQEIWEKSGNVDAQVAMVLPAAVLPKVRQMVQSDPNLDKTVESDVAMGKQDDLRQTPTIIIVTHGKRQTIPAAPSYSLLKAYLDELLASH